MTEQPTWELGGSDYVQHRMFRALAVRPSAGEWLSLY